MEITKISERFNKVAEKYDSQRRFFIPCFDDYYGTSIKFLAHLRKSFTSILDLGAGTGLLTQFLYEQFPESSYILADISEQMLDVARERFDGLDNFEYQVVDYSKELPTGNFDLITSGLSIHHLEHEDKARLYQTIYDSLPVNGCFFNIDQFNASSPSINELYNSWWYDSIKSSGISEQDREMWLKRRELDRENSIEDTLTLLRHIGFSTVECIYSYMKFGVILAIKESA